MAGAALAVRSDPARAITVGAALLGGAVLADSALEHYRGSFRNPFMIAPLAAATILLKATMSRAAGNRAARGKGAYLVAVVTGTIGLGFHLWNVVKRPGRFDWQNLFYGAPIGAPAALILAGASGAAAVALDSPKGGLGPIAVGSGRAIGGLAALGLAGTAAEAGLLHFRGAYHDPFMWAPVTVPPIAALSLTRDVLAGDPRPASRILLAATAALGLVGSAFHAWGVHREMGGWHNWRQNILAGPPLPAPPAFTGLALIGLAAIALMGRRRG